MDPKIPDYENEQHRIERREVYRRTDEPGEEFARAIGHQINQSTYHRLLIDEMNAERDHEYLTRGRYGKNRQPAARFRARAAELIEYWYWNAPETRVYREGTPQGVLDAFESGRAGAMWARLLRMAHDAEKGTKE